MKACKCNVGLSDTGTACTPIQAVTEKVILVPYYDETGAQNQIDLSATLDSAYFTARVNDVDTFKRWYPLPAMKNVVDNRADDQRESFDDGTEAFITQGARKFEGLIIGGTPQLLGHIKDARCVEVGVFIIDKQGNIIGAENTAGFLDPIRLDKETLSAMLMKTTDKTVQKIKVSYNFHVQEMDENLRMITSDEMTYNVINLAGLLDITSENSSISTTGFTLDLFTEYGTPITPVKDEGLVSADFKSSVTATASRLRNQTTSADVIITTVTETAEGKYVFVFAAQTSGDVLIVKPVRNGRDYSAVEANTVTIP